MRLKSVSLIAAAAALGVAPLAAQAAPSVRSLAPADEASELGGGSSQFIALLVVAAVIAAGIVLTDDDDPISA